MPRLLKHSAPLRGLVLLWQRRPHYLWGMLATADQMWDLLGLPDSDKDKCHHATLLWNFPEGTTEGEGGGVVEVGGPLAEARWDSTSSGCSGTRRGLRTRSARGRMTPWGKLGTCWAEPAEFFCFFLFKLTKPQLQK